MRQALRRWLGLMVVVAASTAVLVVSCGGDSDSGGGIGAGGLGNGASSGTAGSGGNLFGDAGVNDVVDLSFNPSSATLVVDGSSPQSASFELVATFGSSDSLVVAAESLEFDRPDLATLDPGPPAVLTAVGDYAGTGELHGIYQGHEAVATLTVQVHKSDVEGGLDPAAVAALDDPALPQDPLVSSLLYPYDATVFPLGLASPLVMWSAPQSGDIYRLHYQQAGYAFDTYRVVSTPAQLRADQQVWDYLTTSNQGDALTVTLSRYDVATFTAYQSATESWSVAPESLRGAIYYWTTSAGGHLARIQPGTGAQPTTVNGGACMGCHAVSADGSTLVASWEGQPVNDGTGDNRAWSSWDLPGETLRTLSTYFSGLLAVTPDGKYTVFGSQTLKLGDTNSGQVVANTGLETMPLEPGMVGFMKPAFSPDGTKLAMVEGTGTWYHNLHDGQLVVVDFDPASVTFSNKQPLAHTSGFPPGQRVIDYPSFTPDSQWVAFDVTNDPDGRDWGDMWLQQLSGSPLIRLDALTDAAPVAADDNHVLEPTFNPEERGGYFWVVFTSSRNWGNRITGSQTDINQERLWVAAIDAQIGTIDPSHPPFFLEGQEENTKNRRGFWTLAPCIATGDPTPCGAGFECCSGFCINSVCGEPNDNPCVGVGESCVDATDCCNAGFVDCVDGKCAPKVPS